LESEEGRYPVIVPYNCPEPDLGLDVRGDAILSSVLSSGGERAGAGLPVPLRSYEPIGEIA